MFMIISIKLLLCSIFLVIYISSNYNTMAYYFLYFFCILKYIDYYSFIINFARLKYSNIFKIKRGKYPLVLQPQIS